MPREELRKLLDRLETEIRDSEDISRGQRQELERIRARLEGALERGPDDEAEEESGPETVRSELERFSVEYPRVSLTIQRILDTLNKIGI